MMRYYILINFDESGYNLLIYTFAVSTVAGLGLQVTFPLFVHTIFEVPYKRKVYIIVAILTAVSIVILILNQISTPISQMLNEKKISANTGTVLFSIILYGIFFYCMSIIALYYRTLSESLEKKLAKSFLIIGVVFFPGSIYENIFKDYYLSKDLYTAVFFIPAFYFFWSIIITCYLGQFIVSDKNEIDYFNSLQRFNKEYNITDREGDIVRLLLNGLSNSEICDELSISQNTVKSHLKNIFQKSGARSRIDLLSIIIQEK